MASRTSLEGSAEKKLYDAAAKGDTGSLHELLEDDPLFLNRVSHTSPNKTPLHVATLNGHLNFVKEILRLNPQLAEELDFQRSSALHSASAKGYFDIAKELLSAAPEMCLVCDSQGRNPVHIAAINGHVEILTELIRVNPLAACGKTNRGLNVLHLCIQHDRLEALKVVVPTVTELINAKDDGGDTILHMAVKKNRLEIIDYLIRDTKIDTNVENSIGETARDIFLQCGTHATETRNNNILRPLFRSPLISTETHEHIVWLRKNGDLLIVLAGLVANMAFQAGINPPGGVWQDDYIVDSNGNPVPNPHRAGESVMAHHHPGLYVKFVITNTAALGCSLYHIAHFVSTTTLRRLFVEGRLFVCSIFAAVYVMIFLMASTYGASINAITPKSTDVMERLRNQIRIWMIIWFGVLPCVAILIPVVIMYRKMAKRLRSTSVEEIGQHVDADQENNV